MSSVAVSTRSVNWKEVGLFVGLTITLSWLIDLVLWLKFGYSEYAQLFFQLQMLIPAYVAIFLQRYVFKNSPLYLHNYHERPRWFFNFYIIFTLFFTALVILTTLRPDLYPAPLAGLVMLALVVSLVILLIVRFASGKDAFQQAGLSGGKWYLWLLVWVVVMAYLGLQILLNIVAGLGYHLDFVQNNPCSILMMQNSRVSIIDVQNSRGSNPKNAANSRSNRRHVVRTLIISQIRADHSPF